MIPEIRIEVSSHLNTPGLLHLILDVLHVA